MAFIYNPGAFDRGFNTVGGYYDNERRNEALAYERLRQAEADAQRRMEFDQRQSDRQRNIANADSLSGLLDEADASSGAASFLQNYRTSPAQPTAQYAPPANPATDNVTTAPTAVTSNVAGLSMGAQGKAPANVKAFIAEYGTMAEAAAKRLGVSPDVVLAQWGLETGWGKKVIPGTNNIGNIKDPTGKGVYATDNATGSRDAYKVYATPDEGAAAYSDFVLGNRGRYKAAVGTGDNANAFFSGLKAGVYAEDEQYVKKGVAATETVRRAMGIAPAGARSQALSRKAVPPTMPADLQALPQQGLSSTQVPMVEAGADTPAGLTSATVPGAPREATQAEKPAVDPRLAQLKLLAYNAMRNGDTATATKIAETYHNLRLDNEMGQVASHVMKAGPDELNAVFQRLGGDLNSGLRGVLLEQKFDPATGMSALVIGDKRVPLSRTDAATLLSGIYAIQKGHVSSGYNRIAAVDKDLAELATGQNKLTEAVNKSGNDAQYKAQNIAALQGKNDTAAQKQQLGLQFANRVDGVLEGFQAALQAGPDGAKAARVYADEYDQLRATAGQYGLRTPPPLSALASAQRGQKESKPVKIEEYGVPYLIDGKEHISNGRGGYTIKGGIAPDQFSTTLEKAGVPEFAWGDFVLSDDGSMVAYRGETHAISDLPKLAQAALERAALERAISESQKARANPPAERRGLLTKAEPEPGVPWPSPNRTGLKPN